MPSRSHRSGPSPDKSKSKPKFGIASPGKAVDPTRIGNEQDVESTEGQPRSAPAPGIPISKERYDWLKRKARVVRTPPSTYKQEDPSAQGRKRGKRKRGQ